MTTDTTTADILAFVPQRPTVPEAAGVTRRRYRTIWISDVHLGTRGCNADMLIDFLDHVDSDQLYLVGDIIDGWRLKKRFYWPASHNDVVWRLMKRAKRGTRVTYIPGNHDEVFRQFAGMDFGGVKIRRKAIHTTADGRRLLVLHGDEFDAITLAHRWVAFIGDSAYTALMVVNQWLNVARRWLGLPYWSLSKHAKAKVKNAVAFISHFEEVVAHAAGSRGVDGVVCGHIHTAEIRDIQGVAYYNDGDWVEGCTALVEHFDGRMELLHWADEIAARNAPASTDSVTRAA
ncbi:UDP-2,3-diacylglucosamine diphosphatase [Sphingomonas sp. S6]|jgi:UDP-2,3-diacylglucosamine pyrophosphatase LpxH|uniref:UDP-2,3-diacylglucosamine diphosphatase n=1 Tax=Sphingomonas sp. S6 TaxID=3368600 RepID=UPI000FA8C548|nr:UDP-2,3-diacylglucosamine diphosphatase [uncultured Sphingomonas sp.]RTL21815.1 MAG: UDP-2,3-diacylglucosamine diphosphatase [Sphingomonadaceae bacterium]